MPNDFWQKSLTNRATRLSFWQNGRYIILTPYVSASSIPPERAVRTESEKNFAVFLHGRKKPIIFALRLIFGIDRYGGCSSVGESVGLWFRKSWVRAPSSTRKGLLRKAFFIIHKLPRTYHSEYIPKREIYRSSAKTSSPETGIYNPRINPIPSR